MYKVCFYSNMYQKEITKSFENAKDALAFAKMVNGIVVC